MIIDCALTRNLSLSWLLIKHNSFHHQSCTFTYLDRASRSIFFLSEVHPTRSLSRSVCTPGTSIKSYVFCYRFWPCPTWFVAVKNRTEEDDASSYREIFAFWIVQLMGGELGRYKRGNLNDRG